jgi:SET domain-containing protein
MPKSKKQSKKNKYTPGDFQLAVRRSRSGLGLFAVDTIPKGACIIEYVGKVLTNEEYERTNSRYLFDIGKKQVLDGSPRWNKARYINHSCVPNCETDVHKHRVYVLALRKIKPGEELAYDYGKEYFDEYIGENCTCPKCKPPEPEVAVEPEAAEAA